MGRVSHIKKILEAIGNYNYLKTQDIDESKFISYSNDPNYQNFIKFYRKTLNKKVNNYAKNLSALFDKYDNDDEKFRRDYAVDKFDFKSRPVSGLNDAELEKNYINNNMKFLETQNKKKLSPENFIQQYNKKNRSKSINLTKDFELLNGKDTYVVVGNKKVYKLHPDDSLFATKEKGYWNKMLIRFANVYEDVIAKISSKSNKSFNDLKIKSSILKESINSLTLNVLKYSTEILKNASDRINKHTDVFGNNLKNLFKNYSEINNSIEKQSKEIIVANNNFNNVSIVKSQIENVLKEATDNLNIEENASEDDINDLYDLCKDIIMIAVNKKTKVNTQVVIG
jgi:flagellar biosynthesis chaperone FliJ